MRGSGRKPKELLNGQFLITGSTKETDEKNRRAVFMKYFDLFKNFKISKNKMQEIRVNMLTFYESLP